MNKFSETEIIWQLRNWAIEVESPRNDGWTKYHYLSKLMKIKDLYVRPNHILAALKWLKVNNHLYEHIEID